MLAVVALFCLTDFLEFEGASIKPDTLMAARSEAKEDSPPFAISSEG
jgi:hypothetical protein